MGDKCGTAHGNRYDPAGPAFISYRQNNGAEHAKRLDHFLRVDNFVPWHDLVDLSPDETARHVYEASEEGIAAVVLVVTPEIQQSQFVPAGELPGLLKLEQEPHDFSLFVLNTIPKQDETVSNDDWSQGDDVDARQPLADDTPADRLFGGRGQSKKPIDVLAPDRLLSTTDRPLERLEQYSLSEYR